tara:strand:+ start:203971 stop:204234 length:264 start_codon:yes stop_codon:yes gene_type:complete
VTILLVLLGVVSCVQLSHYYVRLPEIQRLGVFSHMKNRQNRPFNWLTISLMSSWITHRNQFRKLRRYLPGSVNIICGIPATVVLSLP